MQSEFYKFTNKETGEVKFGHAVLMGEGYVDFKTVDGEEIKIANVEMDGSNLTNEKYTVELTKPISGNAAAQPTL